MDNKERLELAQKKCVERIKELIQLYCDGSQQVFAEKTGLNKGSVSQYVNGKKYPTNLAAQTIATTFKVSPAWVMGFDVPRSSEPIMVNIEVDKQNEIEERLKRIAYYEKLVAEYKNNYNLDKYKDLIGRQDIQELLDAARDVETYHIRAVTDVLKSLKEEG